MEVVKGKTDGINGDGGDMTQTDIKDGEKSETQKKREAKKANKKTDEGGSKEDAKDDGPDVSNGKYGVQEMNQSKDKPSTVLIQARRSMILSTTSETKTVDGIGPK